MIGNLIFADERGIVRGQGGYVAMLAAMRGGRGERFKITFDPI